ncbi:MAG: flavin reductase family protein [Clostridia bacterium]
MQQRTFDEVVEQVTRQLPRGVFLNVGGQTPNTMTMGWGGITYFWRKPVFIAPVRPQRFTYACIQAQRAFTVSVPLHDMQVELAKAGMLSGRDGDKFAAIGLTPLPAQCVDAPIVAQCELHLECRVLAATDFTQEGTEREIVESIYPTHDFHTLFFGEIVACYSSV